MSAQALINFIAGLRNTAKDGLNVSVVGSLTQFEDVVTSANPITVTPGSSVILFSTGTTPWQTSNKRVASAASLGSSNKWHLHLKCYTSDGSLAVGEVPIASFATAPVIAGGGVADLFTSRYALRFYNDDTVSITFNRITRAEVAN